VDGILGAISKLGKSESDFVGGTFVAPVVDATEVRAWIGRISHPLSIGRPERPGWYRFKASGFKTAEMVGDADIEEIDGYLARLPKLMVTVALRIDGVYHGIPMKGNARGLEWGRLHPVFLTDDMVDDFDRVVCRHDGANLWYERLDASNDPSKAVYLREMFAKPIEAAYIRYPGLTFEERAVYAMRMALDREARERMRRMRSAERRRRQEELRSRSERGIRADVEHAGGVFLGFREKATQYEVTYEVDGEQYTSIVAKDSAHTVLSAGICLEGGDSNFDLKSLVTVMREGQDRNAIYRW